ncbi:MAG: multiheme c-type cytochrome [Bacteroidales bacterium]|nr:multiheme c-type cytochrome [Bacteroidales bacterium]MDZ4205508.1 multiheme c-type cytochrome [Bacteroidales bacterium]
MKCLNTKQCLIIVGAIAAFGAFAAAFSPVSNQKSQATYKYDDFKTPEYCGTACHNDIYRQWKQSMMSQAYTHHWDEIEYFNLAVPHARLDAKVAEVEAGCNGCHTPMAFLAGDVPPPRPEKNSRANESVSCEEQLNCAYIPISLKPNPAKR